MQSLESKSHGRDAVSATTVFEPVALFIFIFLFFLG